MAQTAGPTASIGFSALPTATAGQLATVRVSIKNTSASGTPTVTFGVDGSLEAPTTGKAVGYWGYQTVKLAPGQEVVITLRTVSALPSGYSALTSVFRVVYGGKTLDSIEGTMHFSTSTTGSGHQTSPPTQHTSSGLAALLTPTNIAIGVAGAVGLGLIGYAVLAKPKPRYAPMEYAESA